MGYGLRNVVDKRKALQEIYRVLKAGTLISLSKIRSLCGYGVVICSSFLNLMKFSGSRVSILDFNKSSQPVTSLIQVFQFMIFWTPILFLYNNVEIARHIFGGKNKKHSLIVHFRRSLTWNLNSAFRQSNVSHSASVASIRHWTVSDVFVSLIGMDDRQCCCPGCGWLWPWRGVQIFEKLNQGIFNRFCLLFSLGNLFRFMDFYSNWLIMRVL